MKRIELDMWLESEVTIVVSGAELDRLVYALAEQEGVVRRAAVAARKPAPRVSGLLDRLMRQQDAARSC